MSGSKAVVVGAGPSGLKAASTLSSLEYDVVVVESESEPGGVLSLLERTREYRGLAKGLLSRLLDEIERYDVKLELETTAFKLEGRTLNAISPRGAMRIKADLIVLASGFRDKTLLEMGILGVRPAGIWGSWAALDLLARDDALVGKSPLVILDDILGYVYCLEAADRGAEVKALIPRWRLRLYQANRLERAGVEIIADDAPVAVGGGSRVEYVETAQGSRIRCDSLVVASRTPHRQPVDFEEPTSRFTVPGSDRVVVVGNALAPMEDPELIAESSATIIGYTLSSAHVGSGDASVDVEDPDIYALAPQKIPLGVNQALLYVKCRGPGKLKVKGLEFNFNGLCERLITFPPPQEKKISLSFQPHP